MEKDYSDIINLPHHVSRTHTPMAMSHRAAQFSPFAALTGYEDVIDETARLTDSRILLDESSKAALDEALKAVAADADAHARTADRRQVVILYFKADDAKEGGAYESVKSRVRQIDEGSSCLILENRMKLSFGDIYDIRFSG